MKGIKILLILCSLSLFLLPQFVLASAESESPWSAWMLFWRVVNTAALVGLLIYFARKPLSSFFSERKTQISKDLKDAQEQREKGRSAFERI